MPEMGGVSRQLRCQLLALGKDLLSQHGLYKRWQCVKSL